MDERCRAGHTHRWRLTANREPAHGGAVPSSPARSAGEINPIMRVFRSAFVVVSIVASPAAASAQAPAQPEGRARPGGGAGPVPAAVVEPGGEARAVTQAILEEIDKRSELMANLEYLCDMIGPRLTGSPGLTKASHWTRDRFRQYGLADAHLEPWMIERAWTRGEARGRVVAPVEQRLLVEAAGWSPATRGPQRGPAVYVKAKSVD